MPVAGAVAGPLEQAAATEQFDAERRRELCEQAAVEVAVEEPVARSEQPSGEVVDGEIRDQSRDSGAIEHGHLADAERALQACARRERIELGGAVRQAQIAVAHDPQPVLALELVEERHRAYPQLDVQRPQVLGLDDADR